MTAADRLKELLSTDEGMTRLTKLLEPTAAPTPIETALVDVAKLEHVRVQLDDARRRLAIAEAELLAKENVIANLNERCLGEPFIVELVFWMEKHLAQDCHNVETRAQVRARLAEARAVPSILFALNARKENP